MIPDIERTIVALASGPRGGRRAIVRLAGPNTRQILADLCQMPAGLGSEGSQGLRGGSRVDDWPLPRFLVPRPPSDQVSRLESPPNSRQPGPSLYYCDTGCWLPALQRWWPFVLLYWPDNRSYTGGPAAELHMLGALPIVEAVIDRCCQLGAQPAQRGEFTLRAFLSGKLDLAQAEAVLGVIEADSPAQLQTALTQLGGNLAPAVRPLRQHIIEIVAELEAGLDFVDEDIQFISLDQVIGQLEQIQAELDQFSLRLDTRSTSDLALKVVLAGLPNSGKSSLFNALCGKELAIVADVAGTTRDYLEHRIELDKLSVDLIDTAGWEELQDDSPRALAQGQLLNCLSRADLCILCIDSSLPIDRQSVDGALAKIRPHPKAWLVVGTKHDQANRQHDQANGPADEALAAISNHLVGAGFAPIQTSSRLGWGLKELQEAIQTHLSLSQANPSTPSLEATSPLIVVHQTAVRCRSALGAARLGVAAALDIARTGGGEELIAAELRLVLDELATIIGEVHSDDILGEIFSRFCIGK
ncbi:MAG: 50S ribosome-binding GTPase [Pirellulaceae bacterium]|nr:50S ribosome-binding GTPase [Pirellulaceae bacterium]